MRFLEDGPDLPDSLLEARELGNVVFFCGAGVSAPAGLPDFVGLADDLLERLASQEARRSRQADDSLDRVFGALVKEFGRQAVDQELARALRAPRKVDLQNHRAILDLSRGTDGATKVVTTNFDLLFERADRALRRYVPPALPDLGQLQPIDGVVYLHGRLTGVVGSQSGYVISSADFGRAYLAEGWAARFVRDLRERYTIVLLGYSANDPPMRYLLEGLSSRDTGDRRPMYAFAPAGSEASEEAWRDKGVTTIAYTPNDDAHTGLWASLHAWADAARHRDAWRDRRIALAQSNPAELRPFERAQVVNLVSTKEGAASFASATPRPTADWLCVFDPLRRYAAPGRVKWNEGEDVDPLDIFGLDSDPPRPAPQPGANTDIPGEDVMRWSPGDEPWSERIRISGYHIDWSAQLPARLYHLARWFGDILDQPAAIWWAGLNTLPHPGLIREIEQQLDRGEELDEQIRRFWRIYLEACRSRRDDMHGHRLYEVEARTKVDGWTNATLRELERALEPIFEVSGAVLGSPIPPSGGWDEAGLRRVVELKVTCARWPGRSFSPPVECLAKVVEIARRALCRMSEMLEEAPPIYFRVPTLHPTGERGESLDDGRKSGHFLRFKALFDDLVDHDCDAARREVSCWDKNDPKFFSKLFLYAAWKDGLLDPEDIASTLLAMPAAVFWKSENSREVLFALRSNWTSFKARTRLRIERRIMAGPPPWEGEKRKDHKSRKGAMAAAWLRWLELQDRILSLKAKSRLQDLIQADPRWSDDWAWSADDGLSSWGGFIRRDTDTQGLEAVPLTRLIELAEELSTDDHRALTDYRPFDGVVKIAPFRALCALRIVARKGKFPSRFWHSLTSNWPEAASAKLTLLLAHTLSRVSDDLFRDLRFECASWLRQFGPSLIGHDRSAGLTAFDVLIERYERGAPNLLHSSIGNSSIGGMVQIESEFSVMKAINAPGGNLAMALLQFMNEPGEQQTLPDYAMERLIRLLKLPGDGAGHAASVLTRQYSWLTYWYAGSDQLLNPLFDIDHPLSEAAWHGLSADRNLLRDEDGILLKPALLSLLTGGANWRLDQDALKHTVMQLVHLTFPRGGKSVISFAEARRVLIHVDDDARASALSIVGDSMKHGDVWNTFVQPFVLHAWPRQLKFQTENSSRAFAALVEASGPHFPEAVNLVRSFLRPVKHPDIYAYRLSDSGDEGNNFCQDFPMETLTLLDGLIGSDPQTAPWNLSGILDAIAQAAPVLRQSDPWRRLNALQR